ncbi:MAG: reverse transcriptase family protein [Bacteroidota bacterium]
MNYKENIKEVLREYHEEIWRFGKLEDCFIFLKQNNLGVKKHVIKSVMLLSMKNHANISHLLYTDLFTLKELVNNPVYKSYKIKKKSGGVRSIDSPDENLKRAQRILNSFLQSYYLCIKPNSVHGFVPNFYKIEKRINIIENAKPHVGKKYILNMDLKNFFDSISSQRIYQLFLENHFNYNKLVAAAITLLVTYQGKLPTGAPTSPVISNFICLELDQCLMEFSKTYGLTYTRYADDLTFSSDNEISDLLVVMLKEIIQLNGFVVNNKKVRIKSNSRQQTVTGLVVNKKVNVDRKMMKQVRAMIHHAKVNGLTNAAQKHFDLKDELNIGFFRKLFIEKLTGLINFIGLIRGKRDPLFLKLESDFYELEFNKPTIKNKVIIYESVDF